MIHWLTSDMPHHTRWGEILYSLFCLGFGMIIGAALAAR